MIIQQEASPARRVIESISSHFLKRVLKIQSLRFNSLKCQHNLVQAIEEYIFSLSFNFWYNSFKMSLPEIADSVLIDGNLSQNITSFSKCIFQNLDAICSRENCCILLLYDHVQKNKLHKQILRLRDAV